MMSMKMKMMSMKMMSMKMMSMKMGMKKMMAMKKKMSKVGKKHAVLKGTKAKTTGGLSAKDLKKNKMGKVVSKKKSELGKKAYKRISGWSAAFKKARAALGIKGFVPAGGKTKRGQELLAKT